MARLKGEKRFGTQFEVLAAFHYLALDPVAHPLVVTYVRALSLTFSARGISLTAVRQTASNLDVRKDGSGY